MCTLNDFGDLRNEDKIFLDQFEKCLIAPSEFDHQAHLRLCYLYLLQHGLDEALISIPALIKKYVQHVGAADKYHHTITIAAIKLVFKYMSGGHISFEAFLLSNPFLLQDFLGELKKHYSSKILNSQPARQKYIEPDKHPLC